MQPGKRIVTSNDDQGKSQISSTDSGVRFDIPFVEDWFSVEYWSAENIPADPLSNDATNPNKADLMPPQKGCVFRMCQFPPHNKTIDKDIYKKIWQHVTKKEIVEPDPNLPHPMMHNTKSVDYGIVLSGNVTLILDKEEKDLVPGDVVIQRATNHAWDNRSGKPCLMAFILFGTTQN